MFIFEKRSISFLMESSYAPGLAALRELIEEADVTNGDYERRFKSLFWQWRKYYPTFDKDIAKEELLPMYDKIKSQAASNLKNFSSNGKYKKIKKVLGYDWEPPIVRRQMTEREKRTVCDFSMIAEYLGGKAVNEFNLHLVDLERYVHVWNIPCSLREYHVELGYWYV